MSYQPLVASMLAGKAEVCGPSDNCQFALFTLSSLNRWLTELGDPDIVHWNNGLHDCGHNPARYPQQIPLEMYVRNLELILHQLRQWTPHIIWATTTPVHPQRPFRDDQWSWRNEEINRYNAAARDLMCRHNIPVNDLNRLVWDNVDDYLAEDMLHLSARGQQACASAVVACLTPLLDSLADAG
jgi:hypothetical protein